MVAEGFCSKRGARKQKYFRTVFFPYYHERIASEYFLNREGRGKKFLHSPRISGLSQEESLLNRSTSEGVHGNDEKCVVSEVVNTQIRVATLEEILGGDVMQEQSGPIFHPKYKTAYARVF